MKITVANNLITSYDIATVCCISENNVRKTYIHNPNKRNHFEVICLGVICKKYNITISTLDDIINKKVNNEQ